MKNFQYWAKLIDFTCLPFPGGNFAVSEVLGFLDLADDYRVRGVCSWLEIFGLKSLEQRVLEKLKILKDNGILLIGVINFPNGDGGAELNKREAEIAKNLGLDEVDMVMNIKTFNKGDYKKVGEEILAVTHIFPGRTKLIIETGALQEKDFSAVVKIAAETNISFIKTSTGFNYIIDFKEKFRHVKILSRIIKENNYSLNIKMSGGLRAIKELQQAQKAGADIFGISYQKAVNILGSG